MLQPKCPSDCSVCSYEGLWWLSHSGSRYERDVQQIWPKHEKNSQGKKISLVLETLSCVALLDFFHSLPGESVKSLCGWEIRTSAPTDKRRLSRDRFSRRETLNLDVPFKTESSCLNSSPLTNDGVMTKHCANQLELLSKRSKFLWLWMFLPLQSNTK